MHHKLRGAGIHIPTERGVIKYDGNIYDGNWKTDVKHGSFMMESKIGREYTAEYSYYRLWNMQ